MDVDVDVDVEAEEEEEDEAEADLLSGGLSHGVRVASGELATDGTGGEADTTWVSAGVERGLSTDCGDTRAGAVLMACA